MRRPEQRTRTACPNSRPELGQEDDYCATPPQLPDYAGIGTEVTATCRTLRNERVCDTLQFESGPVSTGRGND